MVWIKPESLRSKPKRRYPVFTWEFQNCRYSSLFPGYQDLSTPTGCCRCANACQCLFEKVFLFFSLDKVKCDLIGPDFDDYAAGVGDAENQKHVAIVIFIVFHSLKFPIRSITAPSRQASTKPNGFQAGVWGFYWVLRIQ